MSQWMWDPAAAKQTAATWRSMAPLIDEVGGAEVWAGAADLAPLHGLDQQLRRLDVESVALSQDLADHGEELANASAIVTHHASLVAQALTVARALVDRLPVVRDIPVWLPGLEWLLRQLPWPAPQAHLVTMPAGDDWALGARTLSDWMTRAGRLDPGQFAISLMAGPPPVAVVVLPGIHTALDAPDARDLPGAFRELMTDGSAYHEAVVAALQHMSLPPDVQIAIVGHSQGGITAMDLAGDPRVTALGHVTHVVVAGSPVDGIHRPSATQVLEVVNPRDVVPTLDGLPPPHGRVVVTGIGGDEVSSHRISGAPLSYATLLALPSVLRRGDVQKFIGSAAWLKGGAADTTVAVALDGPEPDVRAQSSEGSTR